MAGGASHVVLWAVRELLSDSTDLLFGSKVYLSDSRHSMPCTTLALISCCVPQMPLQLHMAIVVMADEHRGQPRASAWLCCLQRCRYSPSSQMMYANSSLSACSRQMWCSIFVPMICLVCVCVHAGCGWAWLCDRASSCYILNSSIF